MKNDHANIHHVGDGEDCMDVMTIAQLRYLINSATYDSDTIVMFSRDLKMERQLTGFVTAIDDKTGRPYLVLTSGENAQTANIYETVNKPALATVADVAHPCAICGKVTRFYDDLVERHLCSKECQEEWYKRADGGSQERSGEE